jgi:ParB-like chromosome segregation protein Spo0J
MTVRELDIDTIEIIPGRNLREIFETTDLEESMGALGLFHPVQVVMVDGGYVCNAGERRLRAARNLGWTRIEVKVLEGLDELDLELAAIDENIVRRDLSGPALDHALRRRKEIYLAKHPDTARGVAGGSTPEEGERTKSFAEDTAEKTGRTTRTIERSVRRAEKLSPKAMRAYQGGEINLTQADVIAGRSYDEQDRLVEQIKGLSVQDTRRVVAGELYDIETPAARRPISPVKLLEDLYNHGQRIAAILHTLKNCEDLGPEVIQSVQGLKDTLLEEFQEFDNAVVGRTDSAAPGEVEPPF